VAVIAYLKKAGVAALNSAIELRLLRLNSRKDTRCFYANETMTADVGDCVKTSLTESDSKWWGGRNIRTFVLACIQTRDAAR